MNIKYAILLIAALLLTLTQVVAQEDTEDQHVLELSSMLGDFRAEYNPEFFMPEQGRRGAPLVSVESLVRPDSAGNDWQSPLLTSNDEVRLHASLSTPSSLLSLDLVVEEVTVEILAQALSEEISTSEEGEEIVAVELFEMDTDEIAAFRYDDADDVTRTTYVQQIDDLVYIVWQVEHVGELSADYHEAVENIIADAAFEAIYEGTDLLPEAGLYSGSNGIVRISFTVETTPDATYISDIQFANTQGCTLSFSNQLPFLAGVNIAMFNEGNGIIGSADGSYLSNAGLMFYTASEEEVEVSYSAALMCNTISTGMEGTLSATRID